MSTGALGRGRTREGTRARSEAPAATRARVLGQGRFTPWLFMAPYLLLFGVFVAIPVVYGLWISLHNWDQFLADKPWVGLQNYIDLFSPRRGRSGARCSRPGSSRR